MHAPIGYGSTGWSIGDEARADVVPHDYPWQIKSTDALALEPAIREDTVTAFFAWPGEGPSDRLARLLTVLEVSLAPIGALFQLWPVIPFVLVNLLAVPAATAVDGWYLRTRTDRGQGPGSGPSSRRFPDSTRSLRSCLSAGDAGLAR